MSCFKTSNIKISALSVCVPKTKESIFNYDYISPEEQQMFYKTVGIKERRIAGETTTTSGLCKQAAEVLFKKGIVSPGEIDILVFVSQSPDYFLPATSIILQNELHLKKTTLAFDVSLGCSGYIYGLSILAQFLSGGQFKKALLLVGDKSTRSTHYEDKSAWPLFGDAGSATLLEYDTAAGDMFFNLQSDGGGKNAIIIEHGHSKHPYGPSSDIIEEIEPGVKRAKKHLALNGQDIFAFALKEVPLNLKELLSFSKKEVGNIDYLVLHQANKLINETIRKKTGFETSKCPYSLEYYGNTSSASVPLTMVHALKEELLNKKLSLMLSGFGVGLSWGSVILNTDKLAAVEFTEYNDGSQ